MNFYFLLSFWAFLGIAFSQDDPLESSSSSEPTKKFGITQLEQISTLDENCESGECSNFNFPYSSSIAVFQLKPEIRILEDSTYDVWDKLEFELLVFKNSTFFNFPLNLFYSMSIRELDMRNCSIESIYWESFLKADKLKVLLLSQNKLRYISDYTFNYTTELQFLFLDENRIRWLSNDSFKGLNKLRFLDLRRNSLKELPGMIFSNLPDLQEINLSGNRIGYLPNEIFARNQHLMTVTLSNNRLSTLDEYLFKNQPNLLLFDISGNEHFSRLIMNIRVTYLIAANCSLYLVNIYGEVGSVDLRDNQISELYFAQPETLDKIILRNNGLQQIASLAGASNLQELDLANNPDLEYLPDPWSVNSLERLDLSNTSLRVMPFSNLAEQTNLNFLNVSNNKLYEINPRNFKYLKNLKHFYIAKNNWNCYNLRIMMDMLIKPKGIIYEHDVYDNDFPGEYIEGIACIYRMESEDDDDNNNENNKDQIPDSSNQNEFISQLNQAVSNNFETTNEYPTDGNTNEQRLERELISLRKELKAIVIFYESKFDNVFKEMKDLKNRLAAFEQMNETMFQHITIST